MSGAPEWLDDKGKIINGAFSVSETVNIQLATFFNFKLLTCNFYDSVHIESLCCVSVFRTAKVNIFRFSAKQSAI